MDEGFREAALDYHRLAHLARLQIEPTKPMAIQRDLALAYSPSFAAACLAIAADPASARDYTARPNRQRVEERGKSRSWPLGTQVAGTAVRRRWPLSPQQR